MSRLYIAISCHKLYSSVLVYLTTELYLSEVMDMKCTHTCVFISYADDICLYMNLSSFHFQNSITFCVWICKQKNPLSLLPPSFICMYSLHQIVLRWVKMKIFSQEFCASFIAVISVCTSHQTLVC